VSKHFLFLILMYNISGNFHRHEIIEFPAVLVSTELQQVVDHFQAYCRPVLNPTLSGFCMELTGIKQEEVDAADTFPQVLRDFEAWLTKHKLGTKHKFIVVTDGPWDMGRFLYGQCKVSLNCDLWRFGYDTGVRYFPQCTMKS